MLKTLYSILIEPNSDDKDASNRELVLNYVLIGLILLALLELITSFFGFIELRQHYIVFRLISISAVLCLFVIMYWLVRARGQQRMTSFVIISTLFGLTSYIIYLWGNLAPTGVLLYGLVIVLSGILLGARYAIFSALTCMSILLAFEYLKAHSIIHPNLAWMTRPSSTSDILGFSVIYAVIALVSWLFNQQMEKSLKRAQKSEAALSKQNDWLESQVKERTQELEAAQIEKVQQVYRFAEMGRISSALFHDLANHLTGVSLEIEGLGGKKQTKIIRQVQNDIHYIDEIVQRVRLQLRGQGSVEKIDISKEVNKVSKILHYKFVQSDITLSIIAPTKPVYWYGDVIPLRQIINNLLVNAVEAYAQIHRKKKPILVRVEDDNSNIVISVTDWGIGVAPELLSKIFEPFYSSKTDGTGIGLYIVKQIIDQDLKGNIRLSSDRRHGTVFTVELSRQ